MHPTKSINIYLTLDRLVINTYFNKHDPAPIYKRQLSHQFEEYIMASVKSAKRYSNIFYKLKYTTEIDKQYTEPVLYAIRRHFTEKKEEKILAFKKFKKRTWTVLAVSILIVIICQGLLPHLLTEKLRTSTGLSHSLDVFAWVILWHPLEELIFNWNPHLKEICLLHKLATAESIILENEKKIFVDSHFPYANH